MQVYQLEMFNEEFDMWVYMKSFLCKTFAQEYYEQIPNERRKNYRLIERQF